MFSHSIESTEPWDDVIEQARKYLETYILPHEFASLVFYEQEHPLFEREGSDGKRCITIYHSAGETPIPIKDQPDISENLTTTIWSVNKLSRVDQKTWDRTYTDITNKMNESGEQQGFFVATGNTSLESNMGVQMALIIKYNNDINKNILEVRTKAGCCNVF